MNENQNDTSATTEKDLKGVTAVDTNKPDRVKVDMRFLLDLGPGIPENFKQFDRWKKENPDADTNEYPGWMLYDISVCGVQVYVVARKMRNGGYTIRNSAGV